MQFYWVCYCIIWCKTEQSSVTASFPSTAIFVILCCFGFFTTRLTYKYPYFSSSNLNTKHNRRFGSTNFTYFSFHFVNFTENYNYFTSLSFKSFRETYSSAILFVASNTTGGATPACSASFHLKAHKHQIFPAFNPGKAVGG